MRYATVLAAAVFLAGASQAMATPVYVEGDGIELGNSWAMTGIKEANVTGGWFNEMRFEMTYGTAKFAGESAGDLGSGWTQWAFTDDILRITGPKVKELYPLTLRFTDDPTPTEFKWQAFLNSVMVDNWMIQYNYRPEGHTLTLVTGLWTCYEIGNNGEAVDPIVPEPVTMAGLMLGIGSVVTYVRKRRTA